MNIPLLAIFVIVAAIMIDPSIAMKTPKVTQAQPRPPPPHVWAEDPRPSLFRRFDGSSSVRDVVRALGLPDILDAVVPSNTSDGFSDAKLHRPPGPSRITAKEFFTDSVKQNLTQQAIQELPALFFLDQPVALLQELNSSIILDHFLFSNVSLTLASDENQVEFAQAYLIWLYDSNQNRAHLFLVKLEQPGGPAGQPVETPLITPALIQGFTHQVLPGLVAEIHSPYQLGLTSFTDVLVLPFARLYLVTADLSILNCIGDQDKVFPDGPQPVLVPQKKPCDPVITFPAVTIEATIKTGGQLKYEDMKPSEEFFEEAPIKLRKKDVHATSRILFESFLPHMEKYFSAQTHMMIGSELGNHTHFRYPHRATGPQHFVGEFWIGVTSCVATPGAFRRPFNETTACPLMFKFPGVALAAEVGKGVDDDADAPADGIILYELAIALRMIKFDPFDLHHF